MVNEEDHLRLQALVGGLELDSAWRQVDRLDEEIGAVLPMAYHHQFGFLTACPTNVGTGLRASVLIHIPGLVLTKEITKVLEGISQVGLTYRGLYGEGSEVVGNFFQVSNQTTLGKTEEQIVSEFRDQVVPGMIEYERRAREALLKNRRVALEDRVCRALAVLHSARLISSEETMYLLSQVRLGVSLGLTDSVNVETISELFLTTQPAHLQKLSGREMSPAERGEARAGLIRERLGGS